MEKKAEKNERLVWNFDLSTNKMSVAAGKVKAEFDLNLIHVGNKLLVPYYGAKQLLSDDTAGLKGLSNEQKVDFIRSSFEWMTNNSFVLKEGRLYTSEGRTKLTVRQMVLNRAKQQLAEKKITQKEYDQTVRLIETLYPEA